MEMFLPMNALAVNEEEARQLCLDDNYIAELKLDGSRYICNKGRFFSRRKSVKNGVEGDPVEKTDRVPHLQNLFNKYDIVLDGEIYIPDGNSNKVTAIMGSLAERAVKLQEENDYVNYAIFDILSYKGNSLIDKTWEERNEILCNKFMMEIFADDDCFVDYLEFLVPLKTTEKKLEALEFVIENNLNYEGLMFKNKNSLYHLDKRPVKCWYKYKREITEDVIIMGFEEGKGKYECLIGSIVFGKYKDGILTKCGTCSGMTDELRKELTSNQEGFKGKIIEIKAMERTEKGMFRHPRFIQFREDKNESECQW